jgi:hypothetical protein
MIVERPTLERRLMAALDAGRIPVVLGGCGAGRTSLLLRLEKLLGPEQGQYLDFAGAATTPERCLAAVARASRLTAAQTVPDTPASASAAYNALLAYLDGARAAGGGQATFLIDEVLDLRTFESFPGLRHILRETVARLGASPNRFVLASRFTARVHRILRDAPARFEVVHISPLAPAEVQTLAGQFDGSHRESTAGLAPAIAALCGGRAACVVLLLEAMASMEPVPDPVAALAALFAPNGRLTARCRESYEFRLHRARGYGALKAILGVLAEEEPQNLTEISHRLHRTPGSTKDYLSWMEDVDLVHVQGKRYTFEDPLLRLFVRLYGRPVPPSDDEIVREVGQFAKARLPRLPEPAAVAAGPSSAPAPASADTPAEPARHSGIIEID